MYICPKCGNTNNVFTYIQNGAAFYELTDEGPELIDTEVWNQTEYFCNKCPGAVTMEYKEDEEEE